MATQSEIEMEKKLVAQLVEQGYELLEIKNEAALVANFKVQLEKHNKKELERVGRTLAVEFDADPNLLKEIYLDFVYRDTTPDLRGILKTLIVKPKIKEQIIIVSTIRNKLFEIRDVHEDAAVDSDDWN